MKHLRIWLLLLLAFLLPVRGAMAASMLCSPQGDVQGEIVVVEHHAGAMAPALHDHARHDHARHGRAGALTEQDDGPAAATPDDGSLCASLCTLTPLASTPLDLRHPHAPAALNPTLFVPAPNFVSDGAERPPRTI